MSNSRDSESLSRSYYSKKRNDDYYEKNYHKNKYKERSRERSSNRNTDKNRNKSHSKKSNNNLINKSSNLSVNFPKEQKTEKEILEERNRRKAKAQLLLMLDNEEKIKNEENKYKQMEQEQIKKEIEQEKNIIYDKKDDNENDPLDEFMKDFEENNKIVKQVENFDDGKKNNTINIDEINKENDSSEDDNDDEEYHQNFVEEINNVINNNPINNNSNAITIYDEDHSQYKSNINNELENYWKILKNNNEKEKELKPVDHSKMNYDYFNKNIYIESPEISKLTPEEVIEIRKSHGQILVKGTSIPKPILSFSQCGLSSTILDVLNSKKITEPFPIQMQAIPTIMSGRDVLAISETGSGKTLAYVLPMLRHVQYRINTSKILKLGRPPIALIMVPTRELAVQIYEEIRNFTRFLDIGTCCIYGGSALGAQINEMKGGTDIVVATPARFIEILCLNNGKVTNLSRITFVVLDEADRMFDLGFEPQISKIIRNIRPQKQILMFSATFPKNIQIMAKKYLKKPVEILVGLKGQAAKNIEQHIIIIKKSQSFLKLLEILEEYFDTCTIIFVDVQNDVIELWKNLFQKGFSCTLLHGQMDQEERLESLEDFKNNKKNILITTSISSRGIDIPQCGLVINFQCPNHLEDYIHRIGRTGRAGKKGIAYTFIDPDNDDLYAEDIIKVLEISNQEVPEELKDIARKYRRKLLKGEAEKFRISGYLGHGYKFNKKEKEQSDNKQKLLAISNDDNNDINEEEEIKLLNNISEKDKNKNNNNNALIIHKKSLIEQHKEKMKLMRRDPKAKQLALDVGMRAAKAALIAGKTEQEVIPIVQDAISKALANYKPNVSLSEGTQNASKIIEEWEAIDNIKKHIFSCEFDINDYPTFIKNKFSKKEFLNSICDNNDVDIIKRGVEGKELLPGHKPLHLLIKGKTQISVNNAYLEVKRAFDEAALNYFTRYGGEYISKINKFIK